MGTTKKVMYFQLEDWYIYKVIEDEKKQDFPGRAMSNVFYLWWGNKWEKGIEMSRWKGLKLQVHKFTYLVTMGNKTESYQTKKWNEQSSRLRILI